MYNRLLTIVAPVLLGLPMLKDCVGETAESVRTEETDVLYRETNRLAFYYSDLLKAARDTAEADMIFERFCAAVDSLNMTVSAEADGFLTHEENDTLFRNLEAMRIIYDKKLRRFTPDTVRVSPDTTMQQYRR